MIRDAWSHGRHRSLVLQEKGNECLSVYHSLWDHETFGHYRHRIRKAENPIVHQDSEDMSGQVRCRVARY